MKKIKPDLAYWISTIFSPPIVASVLILAYASIISMSKTDFWLWGGMTIFWIVGLPGILVVWGNIAGKYDSFHLNKRQDRFWPFFLAIVGTAIALWILMNSNAPFQFIILIISAFINLIVFTIITLCWKISVHMAVLTSACISAIYLFGWIAVIVLPVIPLVMWARIQRKKHTPLQTIGGVCIAVTVTMIVFYFFDFSPKF